MRGKWDSVTTNNSNQSCGNRVQVHHDPSFCYAGKHSLQTGSNRHCWDVLDNPILRSPKLEGLRLSNKQMIRCCTLTLSVCTEGHIAHYLVICTLYEMSRRCKTPVGHQIFLLTNVHHADLSLQQTGFYTCSFQKPGASVDYSLVIFAAL